MLLLIAIVYSAITNDRALEAQNYKIFQSLKTLADSPHFSKIRMSFNDKCPLEAKKCSQTSCIVPKIEYQGEDGYIDLVSVKESYSKISSKSGRVVWIELYNLGRGNEQVTKLLSGLQFSVTTHLSAYHTKLFNMYFSHPLLYRKKYKREYKDNFNFLYKTIRQAVANLSTNKGEIPESALEFSYKIRRILADERDMRKKSNSLYQSTAIDKKSLLAKEALVDVEQLEESKMVEQSSTEDFLETLPRIDPSSVDLLNQFPKYVACLECQKCKLWGTIQVKGIKSGVKSINGNKLNKSEVIFLINLFRQLSITMIESKKLEERRFVHKNLFIICHRELLLITAGILFFVLLFRKAKINRKQKLE